MVRGQWASLTTESQDLGLTSHPKDGCLHLVFILSITGFTFYLLSVIAYILITVL